jgi:hypothetical protein
VLRAAGQHDWARTPQQFALGHRKILQSRSVDATSPTRPERPIESFHIPHQIISRLTFSILKINLSENIL